MGAMPDNDQNETTDKTTTDETTDETNTEQLGDGGKRALDAERKARTAAEREAKKALAELEKVRREQMSEQDKAVADAREEGKREALAAANERLIRAEIKSAAAQVLADPDDAISLIDVASFNVADDGSVDTKAIRSAIDELVKVKPYLAATASGRPPALPGGSGATPPASKDMNQLIRQTAGR